MKKLIYIYSLILSLLAIVLIGCADTTTNPAGKIPPSISVQSPKTEDSVLYGKVEVSYDATDDQGMKYIDLYVYNQADKSLLRGLRYTYIDGKKPSVIMNLDSAWSGKLIYYFCIAGDVSGNISYSDTMKSIYIGNTLSPPNPPYKLYVFRIPNSRIVNITWKDTARFVNGYELWRKEGFSGTWAKVSDLHTIDFNTNDSNIDTTKAYYYKMRSYNAFGFSTYSNESNTAGSGYSGSLQPPFPFTATAIGAQKVYLSWKDNTSGETKFVIQRREDYSNNFSEVRVLPPNSTSYTDSDANIVVGRQYYYRVMVYTENDSAWSSEAGIRTLKSPGSLAIAKTTTTYTKLTWQDQTDYATGTIVERKSLSNTTFQPIATLPVYEDTYTDTISISGETYTYRVRATDGVNYSDYSSEVKRSFPLPDAPLQLMVTVIPNSKVINILWIDTLTTIKGYELWRKIGVNGTWTIFKSLAANVYNTDDFNVDTAQVYYYKLRSYNDYGYSAFSNEANNNKGPASTLQPPTGLSVSGVSSSKIMLTWIENYTNETKFVVERHDENSNEFVPQQVFAPGVTTFVDSINIIPGKYYYYRVKAYTETDSATSSSVNMRTLIKPTSLSVIRSTSTAIRLTWTENCSWATVTKIERKTLSNPFFVSVASVPVNTGTYLDQALTTGETYTYRIWAYDNTSNSDMSDYVTLTLTSAGKLLINGIDSQFTGNK